MSPLSPRMLDVLREVSAGHVHRDGFTYGRPSYNVVNLRRITDTCRALARRGLITPGQRQERERHTVWQITDEGRAELARWDGGDT